MISLDSPIRVIPFINDSYEKKLQKIGILTIKDLLLSFPRKYSNNTNLKKINELNIENDGSEIIILKGKANSFKNVYIRGGRTMQSCKLNDGTGEITCLWFNQPFLKNVFNNNKEFLFSGKLKEKGKKLNFLPNLYEEVKLFKDNIHLNRITPEYNLTKGISPKWFRNRVRWIIDNLDEIDIPDELKEQNYLKKTIKEDLYEIHFPSSRDNFFSAINELGIYELVNLRLKILKKRESREKFKSIKISNLAKDINEFIEKLPFTLTNDQLKTFEGISEKILKNESLECLIQGDVGSGKTIVAILLSILIVKNGYQVIFLAPTTILAKQHYETFSKILEDFNFKIALISSDTNEKEPKDILIGTTAILKRKSKVILNPGLIVIDEQHKFGVAQREELVLNYRNGFPHVINMSATPIPRSFLQVFFGDLDVFLIKEKPKNRIPIKTYVVPEEKRVNSINWINNEIEKGGQVFWICPLIEESELLNIKSAKKTFENLKVIFKNRKVGLLHGKMKEKEKIDITSKFKMKEIDILVSTTVIEVGIDVPNANIMVIEDADRFGLSQLHQIRGRVGRGDRESFTLLFSSKNISETGKQRLEFLSKNNDGFEIAEFDLNTRGPGEIYGIMQSGIPNLKVADLSNLELVRESEKIAKQLYLKGINSISIFFK